MRRIRLAAGWCCRPARRQRAQRSKRSSLAPQAPHAPAADVPPQCRVRRGRRGRDRSATVSSSAASPKEDFQIFEDGKPQPISDLSPSSTSRSSARSVSSAQPTRSSPTSGANERPFDGRIYVMLVDDLHTYFGRTPRVRAAARGSSFSSTSALTTSLAVVHTAGPSDASQEFTSNKRLLLAAVDRTLGRKLDSATCADEDRRVFQDAKPRTSDGRSADRSARGRTPDQRAPIAQRAQEYRRMVFDRARPPEDDSVRQRGDRLRHH